MGLALNSDEVQRNLELVPAADSVSREWKQCVDVQLVSNAPTAAFFLHIYNATKNLKKTKQQQKAFTS